jgi:RNA polymerase sigma-70 factor, ECF subfamily
MSPSESEQYEAFVEFFARYEADLRAFVRSLLPTWHDADEVVQQVALVIWRKFDQFDQSTSFIKWACVIARFEALAYRRKMARDRLVFREDLMAQLAEEAAEEMDDRKAENVALEGCLKKLPVEHREFVTLAYTPGTSTKELAEQAGAKPGSFYMRLNRIRKTLLDCVENKMAQEGAA